MTHRHKRHDGRRRTTHTSCTPDVSNSTASYICCFSCSLPWHQSLRFIRFSIRRVERQCQFMRISYITVGGTSPSMYSTRASKPCAPCELLTRPVISRDPAHPDAHPEAYASLQKVNQEEDTDLSTMHMNGDHGCGWMSGSSGGPGPGRTGALMMALYLAGSVWAFFLSLRLHKNWNIREAWASHLGAISLSWIYVLVHYCD